MSEFDSARISVRAGRGGEGKVVRMPASGGGLDRDEGGEFIPPFGGGRGGDVILYVDTSVQTLLNLTAKMATSKGFKAEDGGHCEGLVNYRKQRKWAIAQSRLLGVPEASLNLYDGKPLRIGVPPGTVVKTRTGRFVADLVSPGDEVVAAAGGAGGLFLFDETSSRRGKPAQRRDDGDGGGDEIRTSAEDLKEMAGGQAGGSAELDLMLRTVADVGFIGFPNAGKSTLLARLTRAKPTIGAYPFTTLIPNVGTMPNAGAQGNDGAGGGAQAGQAGDAAAARPVLVDLPGLIADAHLGKGLGRVFLRHVRRCRLLLYVVDALDASGSGLSPSEQYRALHRELSLYNPEYTRRPHIVAINKLDLLLELNGREETARQKAAEVEAIVAAAAELSAADATISVPLGVVGISAKAAKGLDKLQQLIDAGLGAQAGTLPPLADNSE